ncbi:unnamed protein product, partial [Lepidochelys olivacea]
GSTGRLCRYNKEMNIGLHHIGLGEQKRLCIEIPPKDDKKKIRNGTDWVEKSQDFFHVLELLDLPNNFAPLLWMIDHTRQLANIIINKVATTSEKYNRKIYQQCDAIVTKIISITESTFAILELQNYVDVLRRGALVQLKVQNLWKTIYKLTKVLLEDHIVKTMAMKGPPFIAPFKHEILAWEAKLEIMETWLQVQKAMVTMYCSHDICNQISVEGKHFEVVSRN